MINNTRAIFIIFMGMLCVSCSSGPQEFDSVSYQTPSGEVVGRAIGNVEIFRGIPYAEKPLAELRFAPAKLLSQWNGTLEAFEQGGVCPQGANVSLISADAELSEDCLYLDIYKPAGEHKNLPVLFWIHGGGFTQGSGVDYDGSVLANQGQVIVVSINYRLGLLGFADASSWGSNFVGSHNNGITDQIVALQWVQRNIASFGGDSERVTIFGESAGGSSVLALLSSPQANGLFSQAISHSPGAMCREPGDLLSTLAAQREQNPTEIKALLASASWEEIIEIQESLLNYPFSACFDEKTIVSDEASERLGIELPKVPMIVGSNKDEGTFFTELFSLADNFGEGFSEQIVMNLVNNMGKAENLPGYLESVALQHPGKEAQSNQIWTDFFHSAVASASRRAELRNTDVWVYRFDLPSSRNPFGALLELAGVGNDLGATHAAEIELTFNYFDLPDDRNMFYEKDDATAAELAEKWSTTILNFAHSGEPNGAGLPNWPKFGGPERMALVVDAQSSIVSAPHAALYATLYGDVVSTQQQ